LVRQHFEDLHTLSYRLNHVKRYEDSTAMLNHLVDEHATLAETGPDSQAILGRALVGIGCDFSDLKNDKESVVYIDRGLALLSQARADHPDSAWIRKTEIRCLYNAAICSHHGNRPQERKARIEQELELADEGLKRFPEEGADFSQAVLLALTSLADLALEQGDLQTASRLVERRVKLAWEAVDRYPDYSKIQDDAIHAAAQYLTVCSALGMPQKGGPVLDAAVKLASRRAEAQPAALGPGLALVTVLLHRAQMLEKTGQQAEAIQDYDRVIALMSPWLDVRLQTRLAEVKSFLTYANQQAAQLYAGQGDHARALSHLEKAIKYADSQTVPQLLEALKQQRQATVSQAQL
jgi:tetratricopeptide (TPR) repeat protein